MGLDAQLVSFGFVCLFVLYCFCFSLQEKSDAYFSAT